MKRFTSLLIFIMVVTFVFTGCGNNNSQGETQTDNEVVEESSETHYTENQTEMGNYMNHYYALLSNGWVYTIGWGVDTSKPLFLKMRSDGSDDSVLRYYEAPNYIYVKGEYIYAVLQGDSGSNVYRYRLGGDEEKLIIENADYLQMVGDSMYYCKCEKSDIGKTINYCKSDLNGKNEEVVLDKEIYYPYLIENQLYYQDDADNETIHLYDLETKEDKRITDKRTYQYVLNDDYMYCIEYDGAKDDKNDKGKLVKVNLATLEREVLYDGALDGSLAIKDDRIFFINDNDECRIYSIDKNGENISLVTQDNYSWAPCIYEDKMIYMDGANDYEYVDNIYICNLDGSDKKSLKKEY